mgnify:CR=1 FL=1
MHPLENPGYGAENVEEMQARVEWIEMLYFADGRDNLNHPLRGKYTKLHQNYLAALPSLKGSREDSNADEGLLLDAEGQGQGEGQEKEGVLNG